MEKVAVVAVTNVTFDGRRHRPGTRFELPAPCAHALAAAGNVRAAEAEHPDDDSGEVEGAGRVANAPPAPAASPPAPPPPEEIPHQEGAGGQSAAEPPAPDTAPQADETREPGRPWTIEDVLGIGPSTAKRLRDAGVADVAALASLSDEQMEELRVRASWRVQARAMASDNASADDRPTAT